MYIVSDMAAIEQVASDSDQQPGAEVDRYTADHLDEPEPVLDGTATDDIEQPAEEQDGMHICKLLPSPAWRRLCVSVCLRLRVCHSVSRITQKVTSRFH